jgi:hypothetical protein
MKFATGKKVIALLMVVVILSTTITVILLPPKYDPISFPDGKKFAFSICDDTDLSTVENIKPVYDYLYELGLRTTKTVWVFPTNEPEVWPSRGETLSDSDYTAFILDLQEKGFEIASHGSRGGSTQRMEILESIEKFKEIIGRYPKVHINHYKNKDNLYWGVDRLDLLPLRILYNWVQGEEEFYGHIPGSGYFWGDIAQAHITYVVNFSFHEINIAKVNPTMPYHDPEKPYVNYWFHTSDGGDVNAFNRLLSRENLDRLEREGGVCIVYTHFAKGFYTDSVLNATTKERLQDLASRNGWFVPVSEILDYLRQNHPGRQNLSFRQKVYLELRWTLEKILYGSS